MARSWFLTLVVLAAGQSALAQPAGVSAGSQIQQIPPAPAQPRSLPDIRVERGQAAPAPEPSGVRIVVKSLHITGATKFTEAELIAATGFRPGAEMDLAGLRLMAARIADFYNRHGYFVAQAYLPAQDIDNGAVTIAVIEGRYGKIGLNNQSHVSSGLARSMLAGLDPGDVIATAPLERRLLLLSDLPGVAVKSTLSPGEAVGTSDLLVDLLPTRRVTGSLEVDNAGNPYTGSWRGGGTVNFNEITGQGDMASVRFLTAGSGMYYVWAGYRAHIQNATVGVSYAHLSYELGRQFEPLDATGTADIVSLYGGYPVIRSRDNNLEARAQFDFRSFSDEVGATSTVADRTARVLILGVVGDHHDLLWGGGWTNYSISWALGDLNIKTPAARAIDAVTARTNGYYNKISGDLSRLQRVAGPLWLYGDARGQWASKNLDSSEKMELGGAYGVRAYPEGEAYGDEGYILTAEARLTLEALSRRMGGQVQAVAFVDHGWVRFYESPWITGRNHRSLGAAGVGLTWADNHGLQVRAYYAFKLGNGHALSAPDHSGRVWFQASKFF